MSDWSHILCRFRRLKERGQGRWSALCPAHEDRSPSLSLWEGRTGDRLMVGCWAGCPKSDVLAAVGLKMQDLFEQTETNGKGVPKWEPPQKGRLVAAYDYTDEHGVLLYQALRMEWPGGKKYFQQRRPAEKGKSKDGWVYSLEGVRRVLYRLPQLLARPAQPVLLVEGEKKADALAALGFVATCNVGGAHTGCVSEGGGKWLDGYSKALSGRRVVVMPDNDHPGWLHAYFVTGSLLIHGAAEVRVVLPPGLAPKGDVCDYLAAGGSAGELVSLIRSTKPWRAQ